MTDGKTPDAEAGRISNLTVPWVAVLVLFATIFGFFFLKALDHESRITKVEAVIPVIQSVDATVKEIERKVNRHIVIEEEKNKLLKDIRDSQKRRGF